MPVNGDPAVVRDGVCHSGRPMLLKSDWPFNWELVLGVGVGGADSRMNAAKFTTSDGVVLPPVPMFVWSSGVWLKMQPGTAERSLGNTSFDTPDSTLYASPAKITRDLFCAFQPNFVTVPSLPFVFRRPPMPSEDFWHELACRFACRV